MNALAQVRRQGVDAGGDDVAQLVKLASWLPRVCLESREIEQGADAVVQARHVGHDGAQLVAHALLVPVHVALEQVADRGGERRQRRLELVRHRRQQAGLEAVGLALGGRLAWRLPGAARARERRRPGCSARSRGARRRRSRRGRSARAWTVSTPETPGGAVDGDVESAVTGRRHGRLCGTPAARLERSTLAPARTAWRARSATSGSGQAPAGVWQYDCRSPLSSTNSVAEPAPSTSTTSLRQLSAMSGGRRLRHDRGAQAIERRGLLLAPRARAPPARACGRPGGRRSRRRSETRPATASPWDRGSRACGTAAGRRSSRRRRRARRPGRPVPCPDRLATSRMTSRYSSAHWPLAKVSRPGRKAIVERDRQDGDEVPVPRQRGAEARGHTCIVARVAPPDSGGREGRRRRRPTLAAARSADAAARASLSARLTRIDVRM